MVSYRLAEENDYPAIVEFYNKFHPTSKRDLKTFLWFYTQGVYGDCVFIVAFVEEQLVGFYGVIRIVVTTASGEKLLTGKCEDALIDPEFRGKNILKGLIAKVFEESAKVGIVALWGFTALREAFIKIGYEVPYKNSQSIAVGSFFTAYKQLDKPSGNNNLKAKLKVAGFCAYAYLKQKTAIPKASLKAFERKDTIPVTQKVDQLLAAVLKEYPNLFAIEQTPEFQKWRIYDNPNFKDIYTVSYFNQNQELVGLVVYNLSLAPVAYITQATFHPTLSHTIAAAMLAAADKKVFAKGFGMIRNWQFTHNPLNKKEVQIFKMANHLFLNKGICMVWRELQPGKLNPLNFYLSKIAAQGNT